MKKSLLVLIPVLMVWIAWLTWKALAPSNALSRLENEAAEAGRFAADTLYEHPELAELVREREFKKALTGLKKDSIHLIVNLKDTLVGLYINGVMIHKVKVPGYQLDPVLLQLSNRAYLNFFSQPIRIAGDTATMVKEPIVVRHAPKDTIEAALNAYKPDTLIQNPAFWLVALPGNIELIFSQKTDKTGEDFQVRLAFYKFVRRRNQSESLSNFVRFKKAEAPVRIDIPLPVGDLRAIYRALPENGSLVLRF